MGGRFRTNCYVDRGQHGKRSIQQPERQDFALDRRRKHFSDGSFGKYGEQRQRERNNSKHSDNHGSYQGRIDRQYLLRYVEHEFYDHEFRPDANVHTDKYANANQYSDKHTDAGKHADIHAYKYSDEHGDTDKYSYKHINADRDLDVHTDKHGNLDFYTDKYYNADKYCDQHVDTDSNRNIYADPHIDEYSYTNANRDSDPCHIGCPNSRTWQ